MVVRIENPGLGTECCLNFTNEQICDRVKNAVQRLEYLLPPIRPVFPVDERDLIIGKELGEGAYCCVRSVSWNGKSMALKTLKPDARHSPLHFMVGTRDLGTEAAVLAGLDHPNIVGLHGVASGSINERICGKQDNGFFILMDAVVETLDQRLMYWKQEDVSLKHAARGSILSLFHDGAVTSKSWNAFVGQRLQVALQIAQGLKYLHKKGVMYRDLKPGNVGLDENGKVKLLDFGLATTAPLSCECAGSLRFMAPEIVMQKEYTHAVDVYAFGLLLWYMCTLEKPYDSLSREEHLDRVVQKGERPHVPSWWPKWLQRLLGRCWCPSPLERASMDDVVKTLKRMIRQHNARQ